MLRRFPYAGWSLVLSLFLLKEGTAPLGAADNPEIKWILRSAEGPVKSVSFSSDGKLVATAASGDTRSVIVWDMATGKEKFELPGHKRSSLVAFLSGGKELLANAGPDLSVQVWDLETNKVRLSFKPPLGIGSPYALSPDGKWLAAMDRDGAIHQYSLTDGEAGKKLKGGPTPRCLTYSPDGKRLVSGHVTGPLVWDAKTGDCLARLEGHKTSVSGACFSPDGKTLYTTENDRRVLHWDAVTYKMTHESDLRRLLPHAIDHAALSPDGRTLALQLMSWLFLYDVQTHKLHEDFKGDDQWGTKWCIAFSPDGKLLATGAGWRSRDHRDNCTYVWKIPPPLEPKK